MRQTYKLIFIALLLIGLLCVSGVQALDPQISCNSMTSNTTSSACAAGYMTNSTRPIYLDYNAWKAFDGNTSAEARWSSELPSMVWQYIPGNYVATSYTVYPYFPFPQYSPKDWKFEGSNDNVTWTVLDTQSGVTWSDATEKTYSISNTNKYSYYGFNNTAVTSGGTSVLNEMLINGYELLLPTVLFSTNVASGVNPLTVEFNDTTTSSSAITSYNASFGDGTWRNDTTFPATNITHQYLTTGNYTVDWYVSNAEGTGSASTTITVWGAVHSAFSLFNGNGTAPHTTYLYDLSTNLTPGPVTFAWDFKDGNTSTSKNVYYTWNITGVYNVTHTVSNGLSSETSFMNVTVGTPTPAVIAPVASFYGSPTTGNVPLTVSFTDVSTNAPTSWFWEFGDGTNSTLQNPSHAYTRSGFRTVNLTATNSAGSNVTVRLKFLRVS